MSNGHPLQNALAGGTLTNNTNGLSSQQMQLALQQTQLAAQQQMQYNNAVMSREGFTKAPRLYFEVDIVTNGFVLAVGSERLIAKDIEELQQHFVAQVANLMLERSK